VPATAYSLLLAENIPETTGQTVVDLATGSGLLAIVARVQGAKAAYLHDTFDKATGHAMENAERNGVRAGLIHLPIGSDMVPLPSGGRVDLILGNPPQLPLPEAETGSSPFHAGTEGMT
jgi:ribosomal protein L11 methylase PrmA